MNNPFQIMLLTRKAIFLIPWTSNLVDGLDMYLHWRSPDFSTGGGGGGGGAKRGEEGEYMDFFSLSRNFVYQNGICCTLNVMVA